MSENAQPPARLSIQRRETRPVSDERKGDVTQEQAGGALSVHAEPTTPTNDAPKQPASQTRSQADRLRERRRQAIDRRRMAVLTGLTLVGIVVGWLLETFNLAPPAVIIGVYVAAYLAGGSYSAINAVRDLARRSVSVDLLMLTAAAGAAVVNEWPEGAILLFLFSLSNTLEQFVLGRTRRAIEALMDLSPDEATVRRNNQEMRVPTDELRVGDVVIIKPAERIPADGNIILGYTSVDQSIMTGESMPVSKQVGDEVFAGTLNQQGAIEVEVIRLPSESTLARIVNLVEHTQSTKAQSQRFTEWFGERYTIGVLGASALTFLIPVLLLGDEPGAAFYRSMTFLVVASPCAIVIAIPAAVLSAVTSAARMGILFKGGMHLEQAANLRAIAFDKTGTLTVGHPELTDIVPAPGVNADELLILAASAESLSEHPLARACVNGAKRRQLELIPAQGLQAIIGAGLHATVGERTIWVGKPELMTNRGIVIPPGVMEAAERLGAEAKTVVFVGDDTQTLGVLAIADTLRRGVHETIARLRAIGIERLEMLTGDHRFVAKALAQELGLDYKAELLPEDKLEAIQKLKADYQVVAMVGDGINDAPSLAVADLGISLGAGTDVALETSDIVLMSDDLRLLPDAIILARRTNAVMRQSLVFAFGVILVLLFATFFSDLRLPLAVVGHEGSTVIVILNGLRLLTFRRSTPAEVSPVPA